MRIIWIKPNIADLTSYLAYFLVIAFPSGSIGTLACQYDLHAQNAECFKDYLNQRDSMMNYGSINYYSGIDPEDIRIQCYLLDASEECSRELRDACPEEGQAAYEHWLGEHLIFLHLCRSSKFFETYAVSHGCIQRTRIENDICTSTYESSVDPYIEDASNGDHASLVNVCSSFFTLLGCVKTNIRHKCDESAVHLVEYLVRISIRISNQCRNETLTPTTSAEVEPVQPTRPAYTVYHNKALSDVSSSSSSDMQIYIQLLLLSAFLANLMLVMRFS